MKWQYEERNMPKKWLPAIADRAVWEKVTKGGAGTRWDSLVEKVWKDIGGNLEEIPLSIEKFAGYKTEVKERIEIRTRLALRKKQGEGGGTLTDLRAVKSRNRNQNAFARPNGLRENAETAISCRGPGAARTKKEVYP